MHFSKIKVTGEFQHYGLSSWYHAEVTLNEGEDAKAAMYQAKALIEEFNKETLAEKEPVVVKVKEVPDAMKGNLDAINNSTTLDELKGYWLISKGNLILSEAYKTKLQSFQK